MGNCLTHYYDNPEYWETIMANYLTVHIKDCDIDSLEFYKINKNVAENILL